MTACPDPYEHEDAPYVLGALSREDRIAYEEHLQSCPRCSTAVAELAGLPGLLARLPGVPEPSAVRPPDTVLPRLLAEVRRARLRRRSYGVAAGVAAAAVLVIGTVAVTGGPAEPGPGVPVAMVAVGDAPVQVDLRLQDVAWGTRMTMTCRYDGPVAEPYESPGSYQLVVVSAEDHSTQSVARWQALPGRDAHVSGSTDLTPKEIAEVQLRDAGGTVLMEGAP